MAVGKVCVIDSSRASVSETLALLLSPAMRKKQENLNRVSDNLRFRTTLHSQIVL